MKVLLASATELEIRPVLNWLQQRGTALDNFQFQYGSVHIEPCITGVGSTLTAYHLGNLFGSKTYDLVLHAGIGGALKSELPIGTVYQLITDRFGDLGAEDKDGTFIDVHDLDLLSPSDFPFRNGRLEQPQAHQEFLPVAHGITVNKVTGSKTSIERLKTKYPMAQIETMESAAFFYAVLMARLPFLSIRSISNQVTERDRSSWDIPLAVTNLNEVLQNIFETLGEREVK